MWFIFIVSNSHTRVHRTSISLSLQSDYALPVLYEDLLAHLPPPFFCGLCTSNLHLLICSKMQYQATNSWMFYVTVLDGMYIKVCGMIFKRFFISPRERTQSLLSLVCLVQYTGRLRTGVQHTTHCLLLECHCRRKSLLAQVCHIMSSATVENLPSNLLRFENFDEVKSYHIAKI